MQVKTGFLADFLQNFRFRCRKRQSEPPVAPAWVFLRTSMDVGPRKSQHGSVLGVDFGYGVAEIGGILGVFRGTDNMAVGYGMARFLAHGWCKNK